MAKGRRDYTWGVLQDSILPGRYSTNFLELGLASVSPGVGANAITYVVPPGYKLFLTGVFLSTPSPCINSSYVKKNGFIVVTSYFSVSYTFDFGSQGSYVYNEGEELQIQFNNNDNVQQLFYAQVIGVLEELV